jgi:hypothetical protein
MTKSKRDYIKNKIMPTNPTIHVATLKNYKLLLLLMYK